MSVHSTVYLLSFALLLAGVISRRADAAEKKVPITFSGGHDIGKNDYGRPVVLMAAALGVKPEVFREAFSGVTPARGRGPTGEEARRNKAALMKVLSPHGVTNDRMDEVANYYRFRPDRDELWPTAPAKAHAIVEPSVSGPGKLLRIVVTDPGSGYSSPLEAKIEGFPNVELKPVLSFSKELKKNGGIGKVEIAQAKKPAR